MNLGTKQDNDNPVKYLENEGADGYRTIVLAAAFITKFIFDQWNQCGQQQVGSDMFVDKEGLEDQREMKE